MRPIGSRVVLKDKTYGYIGTITLNKQYENGQTVYTIECESGINRVITEADIENVSTVKCSELETNRSVLFYLYSNIHKKKIPEVGHVVQINKNNKTITICYLYGYKSQTDDIPYTDIIATYDKNGTFIKFHNISGTSVLVTAE